MKTLFLAFSAILFACSIAKADTLDFREWSTAGIPHPNTGEDKLYLSNAAFRSYDTDIAYSIPNAYPEATGVGSVGACDTSGACLGDLEITFFNPVFDLTFRTTQWQVGDVVKMTAYNGESVVAAKTFRNINAKFGFLVDFAKFGSITRLMLDDLGSRVGGGLYNDFSFQQTTVSAVPLPTALPLYGVGLAVLGFMGWPRKNT